MTDTTSDTNGGGGGQGGSSPLAGLQSVAQNAASQFNERSQAARDWASMQTNGRSTTV